MSDDDLRRLAAMANEYGGVIGFRLHDDGTRVPVLLFMFGGEDDQAVRIVLQEGEGDPATYAFPRELLQRRAADPMPHPG